MSAEVHYSLGASGPVLREFMACRERNSVVIGALGSGKTHATLQRILSTMCEQAPNAQGVRPTRWLAIRNTYADLSGTTIKDFLAVFNPPGQAPLGTMSWHSLAPPTFHADFRLPDATRVEAEVIFLALDREESVRKLRGYQLTGVWLNEARELEWSVVAMADLRHGRYPSLADGGVAPTWHGMIGDTNACDTEHWLYRLAEDERPEGWCFFKQPGGVLRVGDRWEPNPAAENAEHLPADYYRRGAVGKDDDWIRVNLANEWGFFRDGRPVHPEWVDEIHCAKEEIAADPRYGLIVGLDFGRTPAAIAVQYLEPMGRWVALDEFVTEGMSASVFAPELKEWLERRFPGLPVRAFGDPAGDKSGEQVEASCIDIVRAAGVPITAAPSNSPELRRAALAQPLRRLCLDGKPAFLLSPRCRVTRKGLAGAFQYKRLKVRDQERYHDVPDKNMHSHVCEALEYALMGSGSYHEALRPYTTANGKRPQFAIM